MKKPRDHISALLSSSEGPMALKEITAAIQARGEFTFKTVSGFGCTKCPPPRIRQGKRQPGCSRDLSARG